jgi:hypothetical protein
MGSVSSSATSTFIGAYGPGARSKSTTFAAMANTLSSMMLPRGAQALLVALQTPAPNGQQGIPVILWGKPGVGKSSFLQQLERPDFPVLTLLASIHDPTDFSGLPVLREGEVHYARPAWLGEFSVAGEGILFLDELTTAPRPFRRRCCGLSWNAGWVRIPCQRAYG